jgi:hypothetical protein
MPDRSPGPTEGTAANITPDSRVGDLLDRWPALEAVLIELSPRYRALKNPVLRKTVAKVATLRQVSAVGGVPLATLIERLRSAAGLSPLAVSEDEAAVTGERPPWAVETLVTRRHDARAAIEAGEHPLPKVMADLATLGAAEVYELVTPFVPAPLVDLARGKGFEACSVTEGEALVRTYFRRAGSSA